MSRREEVDAKVREALRKLEPAIDGGDLSSIAIVVKFDRKTGRPRLAIPRAEWGDAE